MQLREIKRKKVEKDGPNLENWPWVDIKNLDATFFHVIQQLNKSDLDPKLDLDNSHVTIEECSLLFGGVNEFKIKSPTLKLANKVALEDIYWKVFGTNTITNNEMTAWIVRGFIAQSNGN